MAGAAQLPRPGVEVIQEFRSTSPTIVRPTLVPCVVAPFFEILEVLESDGTLNSDAKLSGTYDQLELTIPQSSFPNPRGNIDELNVDEDSIRTFFQFGGSLVEVSRTQAYLKSYLDPDISVQAYVTGTVAEPVGGFDVDGRTIVFALDSHTLLRSPTNTADFPVSANTSVTFSAATVGGKLTIEEVIAQINAAAPGIASNDGTDKLRLTSTRYGSRSSVVVRISGSANAELGFSSADDQVSVGSGFYAYDDNDGDALSPRLRVWKGTKQVDMGDPDDPFIATVPNFNDDSLLAGDQVVADGVNIGEVFEVESDQLTMQVEQNLMSADSPFAPRRVWVQAQDLVYPAPTASSAASKTGTVQTAAATPAWLVGLTAPTFGPIPLAESFTVEVYEGGVSQGEHTVTVTGTAWSTLQNIIDGIANTVPAVPFEGFKANSYGDEQADGTYLGLRTKADNVGSGASITFVSQTPGMTLGYTSPPYTDVGENERYLPGTPAILTSALAFSARTLGETLNTTIKTAANPAGHAETFAWAASHATIAAAITDWNATHVYSEAYESNSAGVETVGGGWFSIRTLSNNVGTLAIIQKDTDSSVPPFMAAGPAAGTDITLVGAVLKWKLDYSSKEYQVTMVADEDDGGVSLQQIIDKVNELTPDVASASSASPPYLMMTSQKVGEGSRIEIPTCTAGPLVGLNTAAVIGNGRPAPDMAIDITGAVVLQGHILRDGLTGLPFPTSTAPVYMAYKALRLDMSPEADEPSLLIFDGVTALEEAASPISSDNPGALMSYLSMLNAPTVSTAAIGVPEVSADAPDGTPVGFAKCADFLENEEIYALALSTQNQVIHQAFMAHVNAMSEPEQKGERILFFNPLIPDRARPAIVASGTDANSTPTTNELTVEVNLAPALIAAGIDPNLDINPTTGEIENEVYLDLGGDDKNYLVQKVTSGTTVKLRTSFVAGDGNDDSFFSTTALPAGTISDTWTVYIRGAELIISGTTKPDKDKIAETIQANAQAYGFRRGYYVHPDTCAINITGLEEQVEGYYATACLAGMVAELPPQQGFTNYPIVGLTRVIGANDFFTNTQLNVMAAGGVYILVQDSSGAPVACRHQLSTDMTSIETRELSITKVVDYVAKFMRTGLRVFIGRSNITQPFLDQLSTVIQGQLDFLTEAGVLIGAAINNLIQDADNPDTVLVDVTLDVPFPCNYIRLTLVV